MDNIEHALHLARHELMKLRRTNEILTAKVSVIEMIDRIINPHRDGGYMSAGDDPIYSIDLALKEVAAAKEGIKQKEANIASTKPTVAELEAILNAPEPTNARVNSDGSVTTLED